MKLYVVASLALPAPRRGTHNLSLKVALLCMVFLVCNFSLSQWSTNPSQNNPISTAVNSQNNPVVVSDDKGGAIIAWNDERGGAVGDVYAQRIDAAGFAGWTNNGVPVLSLGVRGGRVPRAVGDGSGGAIITWLDLRGPRAQIFAQRVDSIGGVGWTANGVAITDTATQYNNPEITTDGARGAIIVRPDGIGNIYAQRVNASGTLL
jgi:hypothetical protein